MCRICELQEEVDQIGHRLQGLNAQFQISVFQGDLQQAELIKK